MSINFTIEQFNASLSRLKQELEIQAHMTDAEILAGQGETQLQRINAAFQPFLPAPQPKQTQPTFSGIMSHHGRRAPGER